MNKNQSWPVTSESESGLGHVDKCHWVSSCPARNCGGLSLARPAVWVCCCNREKQTVVLPVWEVVVLDQNVVLCCGKSSAGGESLAGAVGTRCLTDLRRMFVFHGACWNLSLINLLVKQPSHVAYNYTPWCLLLFVFVLPALKVHKNTRPLCASYRQRQCNPVGYPMGTVAWNDWSYSCVICWGHTQGSSWCDFVLAALGGFQGRLSLKPISLNVNIKWHF